MISTAKLIEWMEHNEGLKCFGIFGKVPYFIETFGCPFAQDCIYKYNPLSPHGTEIFTPDSIDLPANVKEAAEAAMRKRDTTDEAYIAEIHYFGEKTYTESKEAKEKAARESRTA